jgi:hypothetical protein
MVDVETPCARRAVTISSTFALSISSRNNGSKNGSICFSETA